MKIFSSQNMLPFFIDDNYIANEVLFRILYNLSNI